MLFLAKNLVVVLGKYDLRFCDFGGKICFYNFGGKFNFLIFLEIIILRFLAGKYNFVVSAGKYDFMVLVKILILLF